MIILSTPGWSDFELLDSGNSQRLERFGKYILIRPDPQILWKPHLSEDEWKKADAIFTDKWIVKNKIPDKWLLKYKDLSFYCKLSPFKHTGVFPEQATQWDWISSVIASETKQSSKIATLLESRSDFLPPRDDINILNLFGYTGIASLAASAAGAQVTHVDASYPTISWFKENIKASGLENRPIRYIEEDCLKFCEREVKRGVKYDGIIMDPPIYGHGSKGEIWDFNKSFPKLLEVCQKLLSDNPLFILVNAYAISASSIMLENVLRDYFGHLPGIFESGELALQESNNGRLLSTGIFGRVNFR